VNRENIIEGRQAEQTQRNAYADGDASTDAPAQAAAAGPLWLQQLLQATKVPSHGNAHDYAGGDEPADAPGLGLGRHHHHRQLPETTKGPC
jgi:hypothetical protein